MDSECIHIYLILISSDSNSGLTPGPAAAGGRGPVTPPAEQPAQTEKREAGNRILDDGKMGIICSYHNGICLRSKYLIKYSEIASL